MFHNVRMLWKCVPTLPFVGKGGVPSGHARCGRADRLRICCRFDRRKASGRRWMLGSRCAPHSGRRRALSISRLHDIRTRFRSDRAKRQSLAKRQRRDQKHRLRGQHAHDPSGISSGISSVISNGFPGVFCNDFTGPSKPMRIARGCRLNVVQAG